MFYHDSDYCGQVELKLALRIPGNLGASVEPASELSHLRGREAEIFIHRSHQSLVGGYFQMVRRRGTLILGTISRLPHV